MDKELMAKVNEYLKANGKRELSEDELDKVVGGNMWEEMGYDDFNDFWLDMAGNFGYDTAITMFMAETNYATYAHNKPGGDTDKEKMWIVLSNFWNMLESGGNGHH